jgi:hypothetical protein
MKHFDSSLLLGVVILVLVTTSALCPQKVFTQGTSKQAVMNERQVQHSKLYAAYKGIGDLRVIAAKSTGDVEVLAGIGQKIFQSDARPIDSETFLNDVIAKSDAIVIGTVREQQSFLTAEGTFVFTDYSFSVEQILKNNNLGPLRPTDNIVITRPGGVIELGGHTVKAADESLGSFERTHRYLLFLDYIPATGAYKAFNSYGAFQIDGGKLVKLTREQLPNELEKGTDASTLIAHIKRVLG